MLKFLMAAAYAVTLAVIAEYQLSLLVAELAAMGLL